ncbi:unnamed protein product, partial [Oppiella nova]
MGTALLERVTTVCTQKERDYSTKKNELKRMTQSFIFIEQFMTAILDLNEPMSVLKAQDLLTTQLQKLLNKPCSHPDFIKPFKIEVKDQLSDGNGDGLDINKMIDGVLNMCFSVVTSDDTPKPSAQMTNTANACTNKDNTGLDDDITEILELPNSRPNSRGQTRQIQTQTQSQLPTKVLVATIGNTQTTAQHTYDYYNQNPQLKQMLTANPMSA